MTTSISGTDGVDRVKDGTVVQADLAPNVAGNGPAFRVKRITTQAVTSNVFAKIGLITEEFDTANAFDSTVEYRFQPSVAGYYQFSYVAVCDANAGTLQIAHAALYKNGVEEVSPSTTGGYDYQTAVGTSSSSGSILVYLNGGTDYVELWARIIGTTPIITRAFLSGFLARTA